MLIVVAPFQLVTVTPPAQLPSAVVDLLKAADYGQWALAAFSQYAPTLRLVTTGAPASYTPQTSQLLLNTSLQPAVISSYFTHEMYHVRQDKTGASGNAKTMAKQTYVDTMVNEEIRGTAYGYHVFFELDRNGKLPPNCPLPEHYLDFKRAYIQARDRKLQSDPTATYTDVRDYAFQFGERVMRFWIVEQGNPGANTWETYPDYYARDWERQKRAPKANP
jgi:hypothetical protein